MIYLYAPFYHDKSNGIALMYELVVMMNKVGIEAKNLCFENERYDVELPEKIKPYYISKAQIPNAISDEDIVIYSETTGGNALNAKNVVYWLLNKPSVLTGEEIHFQPDDVLMAYSTLVHEELPQMFIMRDELSLFSRIRSTASRKSDMVSVYFGKVNINTVLRRNEQLKHILDRYRRINIITRSIPASREQMLQEVAQSDLLISYDPLSNINYEATLLGTPVLMMDDAYRIQTTEYNVGKYGLAFSEEDIETAKNEVQHAFEIYSRWMENQKDAVLESIRLMVNRVKQVKSDAKALQHNEALNKKVQSDFSAFYKSISQTTFVNINFPRDIPSETREILGLYAVASSTARQVFGVAERGKRNTLRKVYSENKPQWTETMYRKLPGDLKCKELVFLMVRRLALFFKK